MIKFLFYKYRFFIKRKILIFMFFLPSFMLHINLCQSVEFDSNALKSLLQKGIMLYDAGKLDESESIFKNVLSATENNNKIHSSIEAGALNELANVYKDKENYDEAEKLYRRVLDVWEILINRYPDKPEAKINLITTLNNLGIVYLKTGNLKDAEKIFNRSIQLSEKYNITTPELGKSFNYLGIVNDRNGRANEAENAYNKSVKILEQLSASRELGDSLNNLSMFYAIHKKYDKAESLLIQSFELSKTLDGVNHPSYAQTLNNLSVFYKNISEYKKAEYYALEASKLFHKIFGSYHTEYHNSLNNLVDIYLKQNKYKEALPLVKKTIEVKNPDIKTALHIIHGAQTTGIIDEKEAIDNSYEVMQLSVSSSAAEAINKLADRFSTHNLELAELIKKNQDLIEDNAQLDNRILSSISQNPEDRNFDILEKIHKKIEENNNIRKRIQMTMNNKFPQYVALSDPQPLTIEQTQNLLNDDEAVVSIITLENNSFTWIITKDASYWTKSEVGKTHLGQEILKMRESLNNKEFKPFDAALSHKIYKELFSELEGRLDTKKRISLLAAGPLTSMTPNVLITKDPSGKSLKEMDWFVNKYATTIIPSIFSLQTMRVAAGKSNAPKSMIAFADPVFNKLQKNSMEPEKIALRSLPSYYQSNEVNYNKLSNNLIQLPSTRDEVLAIGKFLGANQDDIFLGNFATETSVKSAKLDQYRVVYFATHGLVAGELSQFMSVGAEPALVFSLPEHPSAIDDGMLQASEISKLNLNADWVVLSACNTASSDSASAEALSGLAQAFLYSGARSLIVSHWDVLDDATKELMSNVFEASSTSNNIYHSEALQRAMIKLIHEAKTDDDAHPRVWAPFVVVGEPEINEAKISKSTYTRMNAAEPQTNIIDNQQVTSDEETKQKYLKNVYNIIMSKINRSDVNSFNTNRKGVIAFKIDDDGSIIETKIFKSSGSREFDKWAQMSVMNASPLPKPPNDIPHSLLFNFSKK